MVRKYRTNRLTKSPVVERLRDSFVLANKDRGSGAVAGWPLAARERGRAPENSQPW